ncbi:MAG: hypothetical protein U0R78_06140 [Nocardioidaceae bacterium]
MSNEHKRPMVAFVAVAVICGVLLANASRSHAVELLRHTVLPAMVAGPVLHLSDRTVTAEPEPTTTAESAGDAKASPTTSGTADRTTRQPARHHQHGGVAAQPDGRGHGGRDVRGHHGEHSHDGIGGDTSWGFGGDDPADEGDDQTHETSTPGTPGTDEGEHGGQGEHGDHGDAGEHGDHRWHHGRHHHGGHGHGDDHGWPSDDQDPSTPPEDDGSSDDGDWGDGGWGDGGWGDGGWGDGDEHGHDHGGDHGHHGWGGWFH